MLSTERRGLDGVEYGPLPARVGRRTESLALLMAVFSFPKNNVMGNLLRDTPPTPTARPVIGDCDWCLFEYRLSLSQHTPTPTSYRPSPHELFWSQDARVGMMM